MKLFFYKALVLLLQGLVLGTVNGTLGAVYEKFQPRTIFEHSFESMRVALGELFIVAQSLIEHQTQPMHPLVGLGLTDAKQKALHRLSGVLPEVEQDEQQFVYRFDEMGFMTCSIATVASLVDELGVDVVHPRRSRSWAEGLQTRFCSAQSSF
jgi:hypothetical protein